MNSNPWNGGRSGGKSGEKQGSGWNWVDTGVLPLCMTVMRTCWQWPWLLWLQTMLSPNALRAHLSPTLLIGLPLLSLVITLWVAYTPAAEENAEAERDEQGENDLPLSLRLRVALLGLLIMLIAVWWQGFHIDFALWDDRWLQQMGRALIDWTGEDWPAWILLWGTVFYLWWRGMSDALHPPSHDDIWQLMVVGVLALSAYLIFASPYSRVAINISGLVALFFALGMSALAVAGLKRTLRLDWLFAARAARPTQVTGANRYWLLSVATTVLFLLGLGLGVAFLIAPGQLQLLLDAAAAVAYRVWTVFAFVILAISYVVALILDRLIQWLRTFMHFQPLPETPTPQPLATGTPEVMPSLTKTMAEATPDTVRWIVLAFIVLVALLFFALLLRRLRAGKENDDDELRESILSKSLINDQLRNLWNSLFNRLRSGDGLPFLSLEGEPENRRVIRQVYQQLLSQTNTLGQPHTPPQTPSEYQTQLQPVFPQEQALSMVTEGYNHARYAPDAPSGEAAEKVKNAWDVLKNEK